MLLRIVFYSVSGAAQLPLDYYQLIRGSKLLGNGTVKWLRLDGRAFTNG
jgi:hypothetical protein